MKDYFSLPNRLTYYALVIIPRILRLLVVKLTHCIKSDELYVKIIYFLTFGKWLDLNHPENLKNFNEKLQWLKLHSETPLHTQMVDKYEMRNIVRKELGEGYTFPLLGVWDQFDEIDFGKLPEQFVLKHPYGCPPSHRVHRNKHQQGLRVSIDDIDCEGSCQWFCNVSTHFC